MPDIYDLERGLKISLTDSDYNDYLNGNLTMDFYARRTNGSIANRISISPIKNGYDESKMLSSKIDSASAVKGVLITIAIAGAAYGIKKLLDRYKAKKTEDQFILHMKESAPILIKPANTLLSTETATTNDSEQKSLTQEEAIQELVKIITGIAEIANGEKKVSEGVENLSNAGIVDRVVLLEKLSDSKVLEGFNAYLEHNPQIVMQNQTILSGIFGRNLTADGQYVPLAISDIERQLKTETI